jgi:hypothetical protein
LIAAFVIPLGTSSLQGLTHVLTCSDEVGTPFSISIPEGGEPTVTTSSRLELDTDEDEGCDGLNIQIGARLADDGKLVLVLPLSNPTEFLWHGSVEIAVGGVPVPVDIGSVGPGETTEETIEFELPEGTHELDGTLLVGP